jgi:hypothetical protein
MGEAVDILQVIADVREDRMCLVQHVVQYKYAYQAAIDYIAVLEKEQAARKEGAVYAEASSAVMAVTRVGEESEYEGNANWRLHGVVGDHKVFTLTHNRILPRAADDHEAVFGAEAQVESGEVVMTQLQGPAPQRTIEDEVWFRSNFTRTQVGGRLRFGLARPGFWCAR